ncbi:uncharacterized protein VTP21DRAFT_3839 [Calcarisporiella thermophila]|uniref:uncharacterized protein n=1 Tax=Calcarisporiella thermophila TaxID=911321 RepID=UPI00374223AF
MSTPEELVSTSRSSVRFQQQQSQKFQKSSLTTIVKAQVSLLLSTLSEEKYSRNDSEIRSLIETHGPVIHLHLLRQLILDLAKHLTKQTDNKPALRLLKEHSHERIDLFAEALVIACRGEQLRDIELHELFERLELNSVDRVLVGVYSYQDIRSELQPQIANIIKQNYPTLLRAVADLATQFSEQQLVSVLTFFRSFANRDALGITSQDVEDLLNAVQSRFKTQPIPQSLVTLLESKTIMDTEPGVPLSEKMLEQGYDCTRSTETMRSLLAQLDIPNSGNLKEVDVAQALGMMVRTYADLGDGRVGDQFNTWNVEAFVSALVEEFPQLNWRGVIRCLDHDGFIIMDSKGFRMILDAYRLAAQDRFPIQIFWGRWNNFRGQFSFLYAVAQAPTDYIDLSVYPIRKVLKPEDIESLSPPMQAIASTLSLSQWNSLDLIDTLVQLADTSLHEQVRSLFEWVAMKQYPELLLIGLLQIQSTNILHQELLSKLLLAFLHGHANSSLVLHRVWQLNPDLLMTGFLDMYNKDRKSLSRILDIVQDLKILTAVLEIKPLRMMFALDFAALASRREYLNLEKWLQTNVQQHKDLFVRACLDFIVQKINADISQQQQQQQHDPHSSIDLSMDTIATFLRVLSNSTMSPENSELFKNVQSACLQVYPRLMNVSATSGDANATGGETTFAPNVEQEATSYIGRLYRQEISVESVIEMLKRLRLSKDSREQDVFAAVIHNLFDEYRYFPDYPDLELSTTSVLFGMIIQHRLISFKPLGVALRYVLDALRSAPDSKMFRFGIQALTQFKSRLNEWPQVCSQLLQIPQLRQANPELVQFITSAMANPQQTSQEPQSAAVNMAIGNDMQSLAQDLETSGALPSTSDERDTPVFTALNVDPSVPGAEHIQYETPSEATQDKILFIINNVAQSNLELKARELKDLLQEPAYKWFSNYLVVKRASIEPNYHQLYLLLLDTLGKPLLHRHVLHETYANIKVLLNSEKTVQSSSERTLLKNLGAWLGGMTLARNKPIMYKNIAVKELLIQGYDNQRLFVVIPFVCKVLEQSSKSRIFHLPNPWMMAILQLLVELYHFADLKLNLKFEIEVLCKSLNIELQDIEPTSILRRSREPIDQIQQLTQDTRRLSLGNDAMYGVAGRGALAGAIPGAPPGSHLPLTPGAAGMHSALTGGEDSNVDVLPNFTAYITLNPNLGPLATNPTMRKIVQLAIERGVREIVSPVVERSVAIASISTRELILKDFAMDGNEERMRKAAHLTVQNLAASLAMVTCKEPLRLSIATHLRTFFAQQGLNEQALPDQAIMMIVSDNLELACSVIEKVAMEKAIPEIDDQLAQAFSNRKKHRERTGQPYYDMNILSVSRLPTTLPEPLRLKPNGLGPLQLRVYEDFARIPRWPNQQQQQPHVAPGFAERIPRTPIQARTDQLPAHYAANSTEVAGYDNIMQQPVNPHQLLEKFAQCMAELDKQIGQNANLTSLPPNHDIRLLVRQVQLLASQSPNRDEISLIFAQKVVQQLYKNDSPLSREIYILLLEKLCEVSPKVLKEVVQWLVYSDDERKFNVPVTVALMKAGFIPTAEQDTQLAKFVEEGRSAAVDFVAKLVLRCLLEEQPPVATRAEFFNSLDALNRLVQRGKAPEIAVQLLDELRRRAQPQANAASGAKEDQTLRNQLAYYFAEWTRLYSSPTSNEKTFAAFVVQLQQQVIAKGDDVSSLFYRVCIELCVESYLKAPPGTSPVLAYQPIDAFSKLIVLLVRYQTDPAGGNHNVARVNCFTRILSIIVLVIAQYHDQRHRHFNQKPFFRLFSDLLSDLHHQEQQLEPIFFQLLTALSNTFHTLQPFMFSGFAFAWLALISHRFFMPKLLLSENQKGWSYFHRLLMCLFVFLNPFLRTADMKDATRLLFKGLLRVLLVLLHDFPEFLCDYHFSFCEVIPTPCIQLRNLILSAFPRSMRLPDPFTPNLKVDLLPEISQQPRILSDYTSPLLADNFKNDIDAYLKNRTPNFLQDLPHRLLLSESSHTPTSTNTVLDAAQSQSNKFNVPVINSLVLYLGIQAIGQLQNGTEGGVNNLAHSAPMSIYQHLLTELDPEGRYLLLSAIANQLRYPNNHTHYFSCVLLYLFSESTQEIFKEQITRVLLERLIVNRPHPWGLLITLIELMKNPRFNFWSHQFTRSHPEIERLFENVSRSINHM